MDANHNVIKAGPVTPRNDNAPGQGRVIWVNKSTTGTIVPTTIPRVKPGQQCGRARAVCCARSETVNESDRCRSRAARQAEGEWSRQVAVEVFVLRRLERLGAVDGRRCTTMLFFCGA